MSMSFMVVMKMKNKEEFLSYIDENNVVQEGWFVIIDRESRAGIKIKTNKNIITIPHHRVLRIKEKESQDE